MRFDTGGTLVTFNNYQQDFYRTLLLLSVCLVRLRFLSRMSEFLLNIPSSICRYIGLFVFSVFSVGQFNFSGLLILCR